MWAVSATTSAFEVVPFGVLTTVVRSQPGAPEGTRFWKKDFPPAPPGNRWSRAGRPEAETIKASATSM
jgi:hypothetical protein